MLSKNYLKKLRKRLPKPYCKKILDRIREEQPEAKVSKALIYNIMNGHKKDYHGIIDIAIRIADEKKKQEQEMKDEYKRKIDGL